MAKWNEKSPVFNLSIGSSHRVTFNFLPGLQNMFLIIPDCSPYASPPIAVFSFFLWLDFFSVAFTICICLWTSILQQSGSTTMSQTDREKKKSLRVKNCSFPAWMSPSPVSLMNPPPVALSLGGHCWFWHPWALVWCADVNASHQREPPGPSISTSILSAPPPPNLLTGSKPPWDNAIPEGLELKPLFFGSRV